MTDQIPKDKISFLSTSSLHLATLMASVGCKPQQIVRGPTLTAVGTKQVTWVFAHDETAEEVMGLWQNIQPAKDWDAMTWEERAMCINVVHAFAGNLRHFLGHTKEGMK
jgi:hypothetical protein